MLRPCCLLSKALPQALSASGDVPFADGNIFLAGRAAVAVKYQRVADHSIPLLFVHGLFPGLCRLFREVALSTRFSHYSKNRISPTEQRMTTGGQIVTTGVRQFYT